MIEDLSNLLVDRGVTTYEAIDVIKDTFKQIKITEEVIEKWRDHENFRVINASLMPYHSEFVSSDSPDWLSRDHAEEIANRLSKISIAMTKREVEEIMLPGTDAEVVKSILTA